MEQRQINTISVETAENYINGNISDACAAFLGLGPYPAAVLAIEVYRLIRHGHGSEDANRFLRVLRNRVED